MLPISSQQLEHLITDGPIRSKTFPNLGIYSSLRLSVIPHVSAERVKVTVASFKGVFQEILRLVAFTQVLKRNPL